MNCLKCGKETQNNQVFCSACLLDMEKHPVKPGTAIQLPLRAPKAPAKKAPHRQKPEEQVRRLRGLVRWLAAAVAVLSVALCVTAAMLVRTLISRNETRAIGKNYTTVTPGTTIDPGSAVSTKPLP